MILLMMEVRIDVAFSGMALKCSAVSPLISAALPEFRELIAFFTRGTSITRVEGSSAASSLAKLMRYDVSWSVEFGVPSCS